MDRYEKVKRFANTDNIGAMVAATYTKNNVTDWAKVAEKLNIKLDKKENKMPDNKMNDAFDDASDATIPPSEYYGEFLIDAWSIAGYVKGQYQPVWDENNPLHKTKQTAIKMIVLPLDECGLSFQVERNAVAQDVKSGWIKITWKTAKELGIHNARELNGKFVKVILTKTGDSYRKKDEVTGERTGDLVEKTTFEFLKIYENKEACVADYLSQYQAKNAPQNVTTQAEPVNQERETALKFAVAIVANAYREDEEKMRELVSKKFAEMPMIGNHISVDDEEVVKMMVDIATGEQNA